MNSWGPSWCENGFIKVRRNTNEYNVESAPIVFYWAGENVKVPQADNSVSVSQGTYAALIALVIVLGIVAVSFGAWVIVLIKKKKDFVPIAGAE